MGFTRAARRAGDQQAARAVTTSAAGSPVPPDESVGRFLAMAQQNSGWNEKNRMPDGSFGLFGLSQEQRDGLGIGDSAVVEEQVAAADGYWLGLASKWKNDWNMVAAEFDLGIDAIKNEFTLKNWEETNWLNWRNWMCNG